MTTEEIELISNGILKNQLNGRKPMPSQQTSNGHSRPYYKGNSFQQQVGPSVIKVESNKVMISDSLLIKLKALALEEDLDHAIIIRPMSSNANSGPINTYKLDLETGEETLLSGTSYTGKVDDLKRVEAVGDALFVTNSIVADQASIESQRKKYATAPDWYKDLVFSQIEGQGTPSSFIYPSALLFKRATVEGTSKTSKRKGRIVPSPLAAK